MNSEVLLIRTLEDLSLTINSNDEYEVLLSSGLIRKLFFESYPLVDQVNRAHNLKLQFDFVIIDTPSTRGSPDPELWCVIDGIDAFLAPPHLKITTATRDTFFSTAIGIIDSREYTIKDLVTFLANIMGGVHLDPSKKSANHLLSKIREFYLFSEISIPLQQLRCISRIILRALRPLQYKILGLKKFETKQGW